MGFELRHIEGGGFMPAGGDSLGYHPFAVGDAGPGERPGQRKSRENICFSLPWNRVGIEAVGFMPPSTPPGFHSKLGADYVGISYMPRRFDYHLVGSTWRDANQNAYRAPTFRR